MKIAIIGTGYVGLVAGVCFAESGNDVIGVDINPEKLARLRAGEMPIYEPGLERLFARNLAEERLIFTDDLALAVSHAEVIFLALPTPPGADGAADLRFVLGASEDIGKLLAPGTSFKVVVTKSTVPVGTADKVRAALGKFAQCEFDVASNPEFLREGVAVDDFMKPDRVVIGINPDSPTSARSERLLRDLYHPFLLSGNPLIVMDTRSAEVTKYAANSMLAMRISFMNDIATLCERCDADVDNVRLGIGVDSRIGKRFLFAGTGYGGSCFGGEETVWVRENGTLQSRKFAELWDASGAVTRDKNCDFKTPKLEILAFDCENQSPIWANVEALTRRFYAGNLVSIQSAMGRKLRVTADHPVILREDGALVMRLAATVKAGDEILALTALPEREPAPEFLDIGAILANTELGKTVHVRAKDEHFKAQYPGFRAHAARFLKCPEEIRVGRMPFALWNHLRAQNVLQSQAKNVQFYTAKGAATHLNAQIALDGDFFRLLGYYLAEGHIHVEKGRVNARGEAALRERIGFCFGAHETETIADLRRILEKLGLKWSEGRGPGAISTVVSSRVFAFLLRDFLGCGTRCENKALPRFAFETSPQNQLELLRGAFSGDGSLTLLQNGRNAMLEYATVSRELADGLALLLQNLGIVCSIRARRMNKSTMDAFILRVNGIANLAQLQSVFGEKRRAQIENLLQKSRRTIKQHGFERDGSCAVLKVRNVTWESVRQPVYSLESATGTLVVGSGLVAHNCFPKDVQALVATGREFGAPQSLLEATEAINERQKTTLIPRIESHFGSDLSGKTFALWGLAFKPNTDDIREAPALVIIEELIGRGAHVVAYDPEAAEMVKKQVGAKYGDKLRFAKRHYDCCEGADALVIATEWPKFREPDFHFLKEEMKNALIFDGRNMWELDSMRGKGFTYHSIGRPIVKG